MQAASVLEHQRAVFGLVDQGSTSPFAKVVFHLPVTPFDPALAKSGRDAPRVVGVIVVVAAAVVDDLEIVIVVVIRGPEPPPHRRIESVVLIRNFAVARLVIGILGLIVLFVAVGTRPAPEHLKLRVEDQIVRGCGDIGLRISGVVAHVVGVLGDGLHHRP